MSRERTSTPAKSLRARREGAAYTIAEECERLFCGTLKTVFLGEGNLVLKDSLAMGAHNIDDGTKSTSSSSTAYGYNPLATPPTDKLAAHLEEYGLVEKWVEMWDYVGGVRFRGFLAVKEDQRTLFIFFDDNVRTYDLKPGLMALLELCSVSTFDCTQLVACLDRRLPVNDMSGLRRDLGWVGFEPVTLASWTDSDEIVSPRWLLVGMET